MGWKDLLKESKSDTLVFPWVGGRTLSAKGRKWKIEGQLPAEHGWYVAEASTRTAKINEPSSPNEESLKDHVVGYLVGNRLVPDNIQATSDILKLSKNFERVYLIEPGLERLARIKAGRTYESGPLIFESEEFPLGPEDDVLNAFLDQKKTIKGIPGVTPALDMAFRFENFVREETEKRRREEEERRRQEEIRRQMRESFGSSTLRREVAKQNFGEAAKAALTVGGAEYLDHREGYNKNEMIVKYRVDGIRLECTCHKETLRIIDSGICLQEHGTGGFARGTKGDTWLSLESIPGVVIEAEREDKLVIYRHG